MVLFTSDSISLQKIGMFQFFMLSATKFLEIRLNFEPKLLLIQAIMQILVRELSSPLFANT
jgi:hypothetical protein